MSGAEAAERPARTAWARSVGPPLRAYVATETGGATVLLAAALVALLWANSPWSGSYEELWATELSLTLGEWTLAHDLRHWVNDGLMALFFFVVGLEIRRELDMGELRERRRLATPVIAALGGMVVPAAIYLALNGPTGDARGWGIVIATDTAFALAALRLVGSRASLRLRAFVLTLVIVDDVAALTVIALFYTEGLELVPLALAALGLVVVFAFRRLCFGRGAVLALLGVPVWLAMSESGVHATIAGVLLGLLVSAFPPPRSRLEEAAARTRLFREQPTPELARSARLGVEQAISPNERLQHRLHPWTSYAVVPLFALANAGVDLRGGALGDALVSRLALGIAAGLVVGKLVGISLAVWLATRPRLGGLPLAVPFSSLVGAGAVAGMGFTVSLFVADLTFTGERLDTAKVGILLATAIAPAVAFAVVRLLNRLPEGPFARFAPDEAPPLVDLAVPVDEERDHVRGPSDALVTLVEYADFECPYCGRAEAVVRELLREFGDDLRYVFRHLPLADVHPRAHAAAEAAEAAAAQGRFWEMHDRLFEHQDELGPHELVRHAAALGLDERRVADELRERVHRARVLEDVESADASGVAGTPTFFVEGRLHRGAYDLETLAQLVRAAAEAKRRAVGSAR